MFEPTVGKVFFVLVLLAMLGGLLQLGQALANPEEYRRRRREEWEHKQRLKRMGPLHGCGSVLLALFIFMGVMFLRAVYEVEFGPNADPPKRSAASRPPPDLRPTLVAPPPKPLVEGRPESLRGVVADGCTLLTPQEASARVGHPLVYDGFSLWRSRDTAVRCAFVDGPVRHTQPPRREVSVQLVPASLVDGFGLASARIPDDPSDLRWWERDEDRGVRVAVPAAHGLQVVVQVALRHLKFESGARTRAERDAARQLAQLAQLRSWKMDATALVPSPLPTAPGTKPDGWLPTSRADLLYQDGPAPERTESSVLKTLYRLRADFGTQVKVIVLDEQRDVPPLDPDALARAVEDTFKVGRADDSPRRDGALVLVDLATHRAWFFFGPEAPALKLAGKRPFPAEWHGKDLTLKGPGVATRIKALEAAYSRAYQKRRVATSVPP